MNLGTERVFRAVYDKQYPPFEFEAHFDVQGDCLYLDHVIVKCGDTKEKMVHERLVCRDVT